GGEGGLNLGEKVIELCEKKNNFRFLYELNETIKEKIERIAQNVYGADSVKYTKRANFAIKNFEKNGLDKKMICMAKTQYSLSDDPKKRGAPKNFSITVRDIKIANGAGFIIPLCGEIMTMPGLSKNPAAVNMDIVNGKIKGLF
ncbi:MAG: formate--tetrahydrofolate ligase, partial [Methanomicrobia archaeon]|nr:formate--tetrahydrofolate ligase [Methanomicrobia archaeon]